MIVIGMMFIVSTLYASYLRLRGTLFTKRWLLWYFVLAVVPAFVANEAGWVAAEVGRQPWIVYPTFNNGVLGGGLRTADAVSEAVTAGHVLGSIIMFGVVYLLLFVLWIMLLNKKIQQGPEPVDARERDAALGALAAASRRPGHGRSMTENE
jgi:cytochrome d ubiquinol oxidase subunit I